MSVPDIGNTNECHVEETERLPVCRGISTLLGGPLCKHHPRQFGVLVHTLAFLACGTNPDSVASGSCRMVVQREGACGILASRIGGDPVGIRKHACPYMHEVAF